MSRWPAKQSGPSARRPTPALLWFVVLLRLVGVLVASELSGALHTVLDVLAASNLVEHPDDDCDDEQAGHECPPGCPSCHCTHGALALSAPRVDTLLLVTLHPPRGQAGFVPRTTMPPRGAELVRLYRPPRTIAAS